MYNVTLTVYFKKKNFPKLETTHKLNSLEDVTSSAFICSTLSESVIFLLKGIGHPYMHINHLISWLCCPVNISPQTADVAANFQLKEPKVMSSGSKERPG